MPKLDQGMILVARYVFMVARTLLLAHRCTSKMRREPFKGQRMCYRMYYLESSTQKLLTRKDRESNPIEQTSPEEPSEARIGSRKVLTRTVIHQAPEE